MIEPCLQWVQVDGSVHHVSEYAHLTPGQRPAAFCPLCGRAVILKLGEIRVFHAAHHPGDICAATQPETVIHLNTKYYLKRLLEATSHLGIWQECCGWGNGDIQHKCMYDARRELPFILDWNRVELEYPLAGYRPDVALLMDEHLVGAIEVLVTHSSEPGKIEFFESRRIPWLEIRVTPEFYSPPTAWTADTPLAAERYNHSIVGAWQCAGCLADVQAHEKRLAEERRFAEERQKRLAYARQFETEYVRLVDFYYPSGKKYRSIFVIQKRIKDGEIVCAELQEIGSQRRQVAMTWPPITEDTYERFKRALEDELRAKQQKGTIIDKSVNWREKPGRFHPKQFLDPYLYPFNYEWTGDHWQKLASCLESSQAKTNFPPAPGQSQRVGHTSEDLGGPTQSEMAYSIVSKEYVCERCGKRTSEWSWSNGDGKTCVCRECAQGTKPSAAIE